MVSSLIYWDHDPNGQGRGAGRYYHRGNGVWSKYGKQRDLKRSTKTTISKKMAGPKQGRGFGKWPHVGDTHEGNYRKGRYW